MDRGAQVLIVRDDGKLVQQIPWNKPEDLSVDEKWDIALAADGSAEITIQLKARGDFAVYLRRNYELAAQRQTLLEKTLGRKFAGARVVSQEFSDLSNLDENVTMEIRFTAPTFANSSPAPDGRYLVAFFGSQGLFGFDLDGKKLWSKDLGRLDAGAHDLPEYEWGTASSPVIYGDLVIVQCDVQKRSFILAADVKTGETRWKTDRDELPSWGTPAIVEGPKGPELVTNSSNFLRAYNPLTGKELWRLGGSSKITAPTPVFADGLIVVSSGRHPERPIFAVRAGSRGDLTLAKGKTSSAAVAWSMVRRGPYMPTPVIYKGLLYVLHNNGLFDCYELATGKEIYRQRLRHGGSGFSASPVAADGKLYLPSEDGDIFVIKAGREFKQLARNPVGEFLMATPALSGGTLYVRAHHHLLAIGR